MKYDNISCPVCGKIFDNEFDVVVCHECGTPHHRECYYNLGHCVNEEKHSDDFSWNADDEKPIIDVKAEVAKEEAQSDLNSEELGIICPRCGDNCPEGTEICPNCGQRLSEKPDEFIPDPSFRMASDPSPRRFTEISPEDPIDGIPAREMFAFLHLSSQHYLGKFFKMEQQNKKFSWSWGAFLETLFFTPYWFVKKKLYGAAAIFGSIYLILSALFQSVSKAVFEALNPYYLALLQAIDTYGRNSQQVTDATSAFMSQMSTKHIVVICLCYIGVLALAIVAGIIGTTLYKNRAKKEILATREQTDDIQTYYRTLEQKGKDSFLLAILTWILVFLIANNLFALLPVFPFLK